MGPRVLAAVSIALVGCPSSAERPSPEDAAKDPTSERYVGPKLPRARVVLHDAYGGRHGVEVEVAASPPARTRGLMWRSSLPEGRGMLFIFPEEERQSFWMKNTLIPLDMIFIDRAKRVVGIVKNATPKSLVSRSVEAPSLYVLEVPGGWSDKIGLQSGASVEIEGATMVEVAP